MTVERVDHVGLSVADVDRSRAFWCGVIGCVERGHGIVEWAHLDRLVGVPATRIEWAELELPGGGTIELQRYHRPAGRAVPGGGEGDPGRSHLALRVSGLDDLVTALRGFGARLASPAPVRLERGAYAGWRAVYAYDPDGFGLELMEPPAPPVTSGEAAAGG